MQLSQHIRSLRKGRGMTQEQLAEAMGVSVAAVSKWETGQSAPDLGVLVELAEFFQVSVDALLGHTIQGPKLDEELERLLALPAGEAQALAERLLGRYPNDYRVVDACANAYYKLSIQAADQAAMERSIQLVKRLFDLMEGQQVRREELLSRLANQYLLLGRPEEALRYYQEGNIQGSNTHSIAQCLSQLGQHEKALELFSNSIRSQVLNLFGEISALAELWEKLEQPKKGRDALAWGAEMLQGLSSSPGSPLEKYRSLLLTRLAVAEEALGEPDRAETHLREALALARAHDDAPQKGTQHDSFLAAGDISFIDNIPSLYEALQELLKNSKSQRLLNLA